MRFSFRSRRKDRPEPEPTEEFALISRHDLALAALAGHAEQLDARLEHLERRLDELAVVAQVALELPANGDLLEARLNSALLSAELTRLTNDLGARIDELAEKLPAAIAEDSRQRRARTLAETIIDLSDSLDTTPVDVSANGDRTLTT